jgi:hypothetical protein
MSNKSHSFKSKTRHQRTNKRSRSPTRSPTRSPQTRKRVRSRSPPRSPPLTPRTPPRTPRQSAFKIDSPSTVRRDTPPPPNMRREYVPQNAYEYDNIGFGTHTGRTTSPGARRILVDHSIERTQRNSLGGSSVKRHSHYKLPILPKNTKFQKGPGKYKYTAIMPNGKRINFGNRDYQHYRDRVPKNTGGKLWSHLNHNNFDRMQNYRSRHRGITTKSGIPAYKKKYSPSWFSYHFLW